MSKRSNYRAMMAEPVESGGEKMGEEIRYGLGKSSLGWVLVASSDKGLVSVLIGEEKGGLVEDLHERFPLASLVLERSRGESALARVIEYIEEPNQAFDLHLDLRGTEFQKRVWQAVRQIPVGETSNYSEIAERIGSPKAIRAVGSACANSSFSMVVPCHRVLHKDGSLSRGAWGGERQRVMIDREVVWRKEVKAASGKKRKKSVRPSPQKAV